MLRLAQSDMELSAASEKRWPLLVPPWKHWDESGYRLFRNADQTSVSQQKWFRRLIVAAAICGGGALVCALFELAIEKPKNETTNVNFLAWLDLLLTVLMAGCVVVLIRNPLHTGWLINRYRAEAYRVCRYRFLISVASAGRITGEIQSNLDKKIQEFEKLDREAVEDLVREFPIVIPAPPPIEKVDEKFVTQLEQCYIETRLNYQKDFAKRRSDSYRSIAHRLKLGAFVLLILSVLCALAAFVAELLASNWHDFPELHSIPKWLLIGAVLFPIISAAVRTIAGAWESGRNKLRYLAMFDALEDAAERLEKCDEIEEADVRLQSKLEEMWKCEHILERENYAWMRLMLEIEPYG